MEYLSDKDTPTSRVCGTCSQLKPVTQFYKDGTDSHGNTRYRRDCKECYRETRLQAAALNVRRNAR